MQARQETRFAIAKMLIAVLLTMVCFSIVAEARVYRFRTTVPFQFAIGRETLPPSTYLVQVLLGESAQDATGVLVLETPDSRVYRTAFATVNGNRRRPNLAHSGLLFNLIEGKQYLTRVLLANANAELSVVDSAPQGAGGRNRSTEVPLELLR